MFVAIADLVTCHFFVFVYFVGKRRVAACFVATVASFLIMMMASARWPRARKSCHISRVNCASQPCNGKRQLNKAREVSQNGDD